MRNSKTCYISPKQLLQEGTDYNDNDVNNLTPAALSYLRYLVNMERLDMWRCSVTRSVLLTNKPAATAKQTAQEAEDSQEVDASKHDEDYKTTDKVKIYEKYPLTAEAIIETEWKVIMKLPAKQRTLL